MKPVDNTMLAAWRRCPREFYLRHRLHWRPERVALPLAFGLAWHDAMDVVWGLAKSDMTDTELRGAAFAAFERRWVELGLPSLEAMTLDEQQQMAPRHPGVAHEMLAAYITKRRTQLRQFELLDIERPFVVPLFEADDQTAFVGRRDKLFRTLDGRLYVAEHKTTTAYAKSGGFRTAWIESFSPNSQVEGYIYATNMELGPKSRCNGVWIDGALVHRSVHDAFIWIPIDVSLSLLDQWLSEAREWALQIERADSLLAGGQPLAAAFPRNTDQCFRFNSECCYRDICRMRSSPSDFNETPAGFVVDEWDPVEVLSLNKKEKT